MSAPYLGDFVEDETVHFTWDTYNSSGASVTRATNGTVSVYKDNGLVQSTAGITDTEDFDGLTGVHACTIDLSSDAFYAIGANYSVVLSAATIDGQTVNATLAHFSIENRFEEVTLAAKTHSGATLPTVTDLTNLPSIPTDWITAAGINTDAITSDALSSTAIDEIWNKVCEANGSRTAQQIMSIALAVLAGQTSSGGATFSDPAGTNTRVVATVNGSNERTAITLTPSS
jgi:hypothetical protein